MTSPSIFLLSLLTGAFLFLNQCAPYDFAGLTRGNTQYLAGYGLPVSPGTPRYQPQGFWDSDGISGASKIRINLREQLAYFLKGSIIVGMTPISSGDSTHTTPLGHYRVVEKDIDHKSSIYGVIKNRATGEIVNSNADFRKHQPGPGEIAIPAPMPNFLRFNHGIGMHTGFLPGYAASHGCVRMPDKMARKFFEHAKVGTPVIVQ